MSDDRAHDTEDQQGRVEEPSSSRQPAAAAAVRQEQSTSRPVNPQRSGVAAKNHPTGRRDGAQAKAAAPVRLVRFLREVVSELRKVIWPTRRELMVYTAVVLVFVSVMVAFVALLDMGLGRAVLTVFG